MIKFLTIFLKKSAIVAIALSVHTVVNAQNAGDKSIGVNLLAGYGESYTDVGISAKFLYNITDPIRIAGEYGILTGSKSEGIVSITTTWKDFGVYGHYMIPISNGTVYPLAGICFINLSATGSALGFSATVTDSKVAFAIGGGVEGNFKNNDNLFYTSELRIKIVDEGSRTHIAVGIGYRF